MPLAHGVVHGVVPSAAPSTWGYWRAGARWSPAPLCPTSSAPVHVHVRVHATRMCMCPICHIPRCTARCTVPAQCTVHCTVRHVAPPAPQARPPMCARAPVAPGPAPPRRQRGLAARRAWAATAAAAAAAAALPRRSTKQARLAAGSARRSCGRIRPELRSARPSCGLAASAAPAGRAKRAAPRRSRRPHAVPARWPTVARLKAVGRRRRWRRRGWRGPRRRRACTTPRYRQPACLRVPARHKRR